MTYKISDGCLECSFCLSWCPTSAIGDYGDRFWIDPDNCNSCEGYHAEPQCVTHCPLSVPVPSQPKKGRSKTIDTRPITSPDLFSNGKNHSFASAMVVWETCNLLAQRQSLPWQKEEDGKLSYRRPVDRGRGSIALRIAHTLNEESPAALAGVKAIATIDELDIRAACMHLIYAAHATALSKPWEEEFAIGDRQIEQYLGLDKRKDLSKSAKLTLIKRIAQQPCLLKTTLDWSAQGRIPGLSLEKSRLWHLLEIQHHFQVDEIGCKHLVGLTFRIRPGIWTKYFLNRQGCNERTALYQYGMLPKSLLTSVMSIWQQHEGAARMMLWLLFKIRMGREQRITVPTLMRVAYGEQKVLHATSGREERKYLLRNFENDLAVLNDYGLKPVFDSVTYPATIQPLWAKLADLPDDGEAALEFWIRDGSSQQRLTDAGPRGKWNQLMNARISSFELPPDWQRSLTGFNQKKVYSQRKAAPESLHKSDRLQAQSILIGKQVAEARKKQGWSQRELAERTGKSQSWIRDIENGRFQAKATDQSLLRNILQLVGL